MGPTGPLEPGPVPQRQQSAYLLCAQATLCTAAVTILGLPPLLAGR